MTNGDRLTLMDLSPQEHIDPNPIVVCDVHDPSLFVAPVACPIAEYGS